MKSHALAEHASSHLTLPLPTADSRLLSSLLLSSSCILHPSLALSQYIARTLFDRPRRRKGVQATGGRDV